MSYSHNSLCWLLLAASAIIFCFYCEEMLNAHTRWRPQQGTEECPSPHPHTTYLVLMLLQTSLLSRWILPLTWFLFTVHHQFKMSSLICLSKITWDKCWLRPRRPCRWPWRPSWGPGRWRGPALCPRGWERGWWRGPRRRGSGRTRTRAGRGTGTGSRPTPGSKK